MNRAPESVARTRSRGVFGFLFIVLGVLIVVQIAHGVGFRFEALPGLALGAAMMALGYVRVRAALTAGRPAQ
jgi:hypothetical protein